jgi:hypothetical protein
MKRFTANRAMALATMLFLLCCVTGCQSAPVFGTNPDLIAPPTVRLCGHEMAADDVAVQAEILRCVAPGLPVETARSRMEELGFRCRYAGVLDKKPESYHPAPTLSELFGSRDANRDKRFHSLMCTSSLNEIGNWSPRYFPITVTLPYDEQGMVTAVEVTELRPRPSPNAAFFARRPELREPVGMSVEQAQAVMETQKFQCANPRSEGHISGDRPYLDCYAYDESPLGGNIVRVHLFFDQTRKVTEAEVIQKPADFDDLRCMLPNSSDNVAGGIVKVVVFPVRLYAALVVGGLIADVSMGRP